MNQLKSRLTVMEKAVRDLLTDGQAVWIADREVDMSLFAEYPKETEGVGVYYPIFRDGSCAEPKYIKFYRSPQGMSLELANQHDYHMQEKERLGFLLRR